MDNKNTETKNNRKDYVVKKTLEAGQYSIYTIFDKSGKESAYGFSSNSEAWRHVYKCLQYGKDPLKL